MHKKKRFVWLPVVLAGLMALFTVAATDESAPSSKINVDSITAYNYWEKVTGHSWTIEKEADIDELTLGQGATGDIVYILTATRTAKEPAEQRWVEGWITISNKTSTPAVGVIVDVKLLTQGDGPWREDAVVTVTLDTIPGNGEVHFAYSLLILDAERNNYRVDVDASNPDGITESGKAHEDFDLVTVRSDILRNDTATITDVFTVPAGFGYSYDPADPVNRTWTIDQTTVIEYTCTVTNQTAAAGASFDLVNTATLVASDSETMLTDTARVTLITPAEDPGNGDPGNGDPGNGDPGNGDPGNGDPVDSKPEPEKQLPSTSGSPILPFVSLAMLLSGCALLHGRKRS